MKAEFSNALAPEPQSPRYVLVAVILASSFIVGPLSHVALMKVFLGTADPSTISDKSAVMQFLFGMLVLLGGWLLGAILCSSAVIRFGRLADESKQFAGLACVVIAVVGVFWFDYDTLSRLIGFD